MSWERERSICLIRLRVNVGQTVSDKVAKGVERKRRKKGGRNVRIANFFEVNAYSWIKITLSYDN